MRSNLLRAKPLSNSEVYNPPTDIYGGPGSRAMRRRLCGNVDVMVDDVDVTVDESCRCDDRR